MSFQSMSKKVALGVLYMSGPLFLMATDPRGLKLPLLVIPFIWLFATLFVTVLWLSKARFVKLSKSRRVIISGVIATLPVLLLVFQSIHQLSMKDVLLSVAIIFVAAFYLDRADFIR